jgi:hypothetical protein
VTTLTPTTPFEFTPPGATVDVLAINGIALAAGASVQIDFTDLNNRARLSRVSSIYLDTTNCRAAVIVTNPQTQQRVIAPAGTAGWYAFPLRDPLVFPITSARSGTLNIATSSNLIVQAPAKTTGSDESSNATVTSVGDETTVQTLAAENLSRAGVHIYNTSSSNLFISCGSVDATTTVYSQRLTQNESWTVPFGFQGKVTGIWNGNSGGAALVTEFS